MIADEPVGIRKNKLSISDIPKANLDIPKANLDIPNANLFEVMDIPTNQS